MSGDLFGIGAVLSVVLLLVALLTGYGTGSLAFRKTVESMRLTARINLALLALQALLAAGIVALIVYFYSVSWWLVWDKALLFLPLIMLPLAAIALLTAPRLLEIARLAGEPGEAANRTKRRSAAEAALVVPVQSLTVGTILYTYKNIYPLAPQFQNELLTIGIVFLGVSGLLVWRQTARRKRIHRDDGTSAFHWIKRIGVYTTACLLLAFAVNVSVSSAKTNSLLPNRETMGEQAKAGNGGGNRFVHSRNDRAAVSLQQSSGTAYRASLILREDGPAGHVNNPWRSFVSKLRHMPLLND